MPKRIGNAFNAFTNVDEVVLLKLRVRREQNYRLALPVLMAQEPG